MLSNLRFGKGNVVTINKKSTTDIVISSAYRETKIIETLNININCFSSVLLCGSVQFAIKDPAPGMQLGVLGLQISRPVDGEDTVIYDTRTKIQGIHHDDDVYFRDGFGFVWIDDLIIPKCCGDNKIEYTFAIETDGFETTTQEGGIYTGDYYSFTAIEIPV